MEPNSRLLDKKNQESALWLEQDISQLETALSHSYYLLGRSVYEAADQQIQQINQLVDRLVERRIQLRDTQDLCTCSYCLGQNPQNNLYCGNCGHALTQNFETAPRSNSVLSKEDLL